MNTFYVRVFSNEMSPDMELALSGENPVECARRIFRKNNGREAERVVSLSDTEYVDVNTVSSELRRGWPDGIKTIPVYQFRCE